MPFLKKSNFLSQALSFVLQHNNLSADKTFEERVKLLRALLKEQTFRNKSILLAIFLSLRSTLHHFKRSSVLQTFKLKLPNYYDTTDTFTTRCNNLQLFDHLRDRPFTLR